MNMLYGMKAFSRPFDPSDYSDKAKHQHEKLQSRSISFHDREDIRRKLAMDSDSEDMPPSGFRLVRKTSLSSRLQNGHNLQICFMNDSASDSDSQESEQLETNRINNIGIIKGSNLNVNTSLDHSSHNQLHQTSNCQNLPKINIKTSPNNNSCNDISNSFSSKSQLNTLSVRNKIPSSSTQLNSKNSNNQVVAKSFNNRVSALFSIPKPKEKQDFNDYHSRLHAEARIALAQSKSMSKMQMELERHLVKNRSPIMHLIDLPLHYQFRKNKLSKSILSSMSIAQLQLIVNDMFSQVESLNEELVKLLLERDESHMQQDSLLVDIEDLTIFLCSQ